MGTLPWVVVPTLLRGFGGAFGFVYAARVRQDGTFRRGFNPDGTPDASFGNAGRVIVDLSPDWDEAGALVLQPDGRIVVAGNAPDGATSCDAVDARSRPDGRLLMAGSAGNGLAVQLLRVRIVP